MSLQLTPSEVVLLRSTQSDTSYLSESANGHLSSLKSILFCTPFFLYVANYTQVLLRVIW